jgi:hypothetical protein
LAKVAVLDQDLVALVGENVRDLARGGGHRASAAEEKVVALDDAAGYHNDSSCSTVIVGPDPKAVKVLVLRWVDAEAEPARTSERRFS